MSREVDDHTLPILRTALENDRFREVLITGKEMQLVAMTLDPGEEIGAEVHDDHDQVLVFVEGTGEAIVDGRSTPVAANDLTFVHAGVRHNFVNTGPGPLRLFTLYAPPEHAAGTRHETKADADSAEAH